jgi:hypothetical protein
MPIWGDLKLTARLKVASGGLSTAEILVIAPGEADGGSGRSDEKKVKKIVKQQVPVGRQGGLQQPWRRSTSIWTSTSSRRVLGNTSYSIAVHEARALQEDLIKQMRLIVADSVLVATDTDGILGEPLEDDEE